MAGVGVQRLGLVFSAATLISAGLFVLYTRSGAIIPNPSLVAGTLLAVMAGLVLWFAWPVRRYLAGHASAPLDPLRAARAAVLAQAAALTGATAAGWYLGQVLVTLTGWELLVNHDRAWRLGVMVLLALALAVAGLVAQSWCRIQPPTDDPETPATA